MVVQIVLKKNKFIVNNKFIVDNILIFIYKGIKFYLKYCNNYMFFFITNNNNNYYLYNYSLLNLNILNLLHINIILSNSFSLKFNFIKLNIIGLGYKYFFYRGYIYLLIGLSHFMLFKLPSDIFLRCKKKKMFLISNNKKKLISFANLIKFAKKPNIYKGKGITEFVQFKNFIRLKKGKKQQVS